jgi:hypothetical protein
MHDSTYGWVDLFWAFGCAGRRSCLGLAGAFFSSAPKSSAGPVHFFPVLDLRHLPSSSCWCNLLQEPRFPSCVVRSSPLPIVSFVLLFLEPIWFGSNGDARDLSSGSHLQGGHCSGSYLSATPQAHGIAPWGHGRARALWDTGKTGERSWLWVELRSVSQLRGRL